MKKLRNLISIIFFFFCFTLLPYGKSSITLNGKWEFFLENEPENYTYSDISKIKNWQTLSIPAVNIKEVDINKTKFVWIRKSFKINRKLAGKDAVLKWQRIYYGADVWINGEKIGGTQLVSPFSLLIPSGILKTGENLIVLRVNAWKSVPRGKSGFPLIPTGASIFNWGSKKSYIEDIYIEFYNGIHIQKVIAIPEIDYKKVKFRIWFDVKENLKGLSSISAIVRPEKGLYISGTASRKIPVHFLRDNFIEIEVPVKNFNLWEVSSPFLYNATISVKLGGKMCDFKRFKFGMRELKIKDGHFYLNNKLFYFRGSNLVNEWRWTEKFNKDLSVIKNYVIGWARKMNINSFRTHTQPPVHRWLDICDQNGMLILAEFPITYNYLRFHFTPEEQKIFERNCIADSLAWVSELANHPSIVIWVATNESPSEQKEWELKKLIPEIKKLDPTRPVMRAGGISEDIKDIHCYEGFGFGAEGDFFRVINDVAEFKKRDSKNRPIVNSEYIEGFPPSRRLKWTGSEENSEKAQIIYAQFGLEETESMRRLKYDGIFPYMFAMWTKRFDRSSWKTEFPTPMFAALRSSLSPVSVSLDLFNRNIEKGQTITTPVFIINDKPYRSVVNLSYYITSLNPEFLGNPAAFSYPLFKKSEKLRISPYSIIKKTFKWDLPKKKGKYYLSVVLEKDGERVISQRIVRTLEKNLITEELKKRKILILGADSFLKYYFKSKGINFFTEITGEKIEADIVIVWDEKRVKDRVKRKTSLIKEFVESGGKLVILCEDDWNWKELLDFDIDKGPRYWGSKRSSRAFIKKKNHPIFDGIEEEWLQRWNGLYGVIAHGEIKIKKPENFNKIETLLWINNENTSVILEITNKKGKIIVSSCWIKDRLKENTESFDLSAEKLFLNMLNF